MSFWSWFKASQTPRSVRELREKKTTSPSYEAARVHRARGVTFLDYYVFYYEPGRKHPKQYFGPYDEKSQAEEVVREEMKKYGLPRSRYKIRQLNGAQFEEFWGAPPRREGVGR